MKTLLGRAMERCETVVKNHSGIKYNELIDSLKKHALCSRAVAKNAVTKLKKSGHLITNGRRSGYSWADDPVIEIATDLANINRVNRAANECKAPVVNRVCPWLG